MCSKQSFTSYVINNIWCYHFTMIIFDRSGEKLIFFFFISGTINLLYLLVSVIVLAQSSHTISGNTIVNKPMSDILNSWSRCHGKIVAIPFIAVTTRMRGMLHVCPCFSHDGFTKSVYIVFVKDFSLCNKTLVQYYFWHNLDVTYFFSHHYGCEYVPCLRFLWQRRMYKIPVSHLILSAKTSLVSSIARRTRISESVN